MQQFEHLNAASDGGKVDAGELQHVTHHWLPHYIPHSFSDDEVVAVDPVGSTSSYPHCFFN
jgi:hypothetical protein